MDASQIRIALISKGLNYSVISNILDVSKTSVSCVAHRTRTSHRIAVAIATALDKEIKEVFPDVPDYHRPFMQRSQKEDANRKLESKLKNLQLTGT